LVPLLPMFSRLADPYDWPELKLRIRQGMVLTAITMLPLSALMMALAFPLVRIVYERYAFTSDTSQLVSSVLVAYSLGMFVYLGRDVLVRVFYALGDGDTPFRISVVNIGINAGLDYLLVKPFGAPGLVLATVLVNLISMVAMLWYLNRKLHGLPLQEWGIPLLQLLVISAIAGLSSWGTLNGSQYILGNQGLWVLLLQVCLAGAVGLVVFAILAIRLDLPELKTLVERLKQRFIKSKP
jgi:putative peptidoglycan lipid II flippase